MPDPSSPPPWLAAARYALQSALDDDINGCAATFKSIQAQYGGFVIGDVMLAFADTVIGRRWPDGVPEEGVGLGFENGLTGAHETADEVPAAVAWAGQFITARANMDAVLAEALWNSAVDDHQYNTRIYALINIVVNAIRQASHA